MQQTARDIEKELRAWALTLEGVAGSGSIAPSDLEARLPFVRWSKLGGQEDSHSDYPSVDCDVFAATRDQAQAVAELIRTSLKPRTRLSPGGAIIDSVRVQPTPRQLPWANPRVSRFGATYGLGLRP